MPMIRKAQVQAERNRSVVRIQAAMPIAREIDEDEDIIVEPTNTVEQEAETCHDTP